MILLHEACRVRPLASASQPDRAPEYSEPEYSEPV